MMAEASENSVSSQSMGSTSLDVSHNGTMSRNMISCKLDDTNYLVWSHCVKLYITGKGKLGYLTGTKACPDEKDPTYDTWIQ